MSGTTFPSYPGQEQNQDSRQQGGWQNRQQGGYQGGQQNSYQGNQETQSQGGWQGNQGRQQGGWQKKPWDGQKKKWDKRPEDNDLTLYKPYAATGNQDAPDHIKAKFAEIAKKLEGYGYTARVGGMEGLEEVVEKAVEKKEVHLPWREFNGKNSPFTFNSDRAFAVAKQFHPTFDGMKKGIQAFLAKNARLILGNKMNSPALFLLCWTEDGVESIRNKTARTGFTGHPIAIASALGIPVFNLGNQDAEQRFNIYLESTLNVQN